nr:immunoglobulin light chain junction region [Macaca mulatta]MPO04021.1 immunoglobulin light chain junction region [Macaca mulatta]MPO05141.1 immunoglobulin light chain junction region [Macaca mulatta]MPO07358.1 immunoglobulin light chain junction region [Macaca mulatta]MPO12306.1 immunoglobulin light chain junction region [Macaca mulatta]
CSAWDSSLSSHFF